MKRKLKKYQGKDSGSQVTSTKPIGRTGYKVPANPAPTDTTGYGKAVDRIKGFYVNPEKVGGKSGNIDPGFNVDKNPAFKNMRKGPVNDPGFNMENNPAFKRKKTGGSIKSKKKK
jgi:hypothetical protein